MRTLFIGVSLLVGATASAAGGDANFSYSPPAEATADRPLRVEGTLVGGAFVQVNVVVRGRDGAWERFTLERQYGDLYRASLPASRMTPPGIDLYVEGVTRAGAPTPLFASAERPARITIAGEAPPAVDEAPPTTRPGKKKPRCRPGRKCKEPPPEPEDDQWADMTGDEPIRDEPKRPEPKPPEPARQEPGPSAEAPPEVRPTSPAAPVTAEPARVEAPRRRDAVLEDELAMYGAEASGGLAQRLDDEARSTVTAPLVLTAEQLKAAGVRYVYEALDLAPGLSVSRDVQGFYRLAVRGLRNAPEVLFFLDGQRLNDFYDGRALWTLPVDNLARIEIERGPGQVEDGVGDALAVVRLFTADEDGLRASFTAGLYDAFDGHVVGSHTWGAFKLAADLDVASQYGQRREVGRDGLDAADAAPRAKRTLDNRFLANAGLRASLATEAGTFGLAGRFMLEQRSALLGLFDAVGNGTRLGWQSIDVALTWSRPLGEGGRVSARAWFDQQDTDRHWHLTPDDFRAGIDPATYFADAMQERVTVGARSIGVDGRVELRLPARNQLVAGLGLEYQTLSDFSLTSNYDASNNFDLGELRPPAGVVWPTEDGQGGRGAAADRVSFGLYGADVWKPLEALSLQAGLRLDFVQLPVVNEAGAWAGTTLVPSFGPRLGLAITPFGALVFRAHYGRAWRAPTVQELAEAIPNSDANQGRAIGNPALEGSTTDAVEGGAEYLQGLGDAKLRWSMRGFFLKQSDAIALIDNTGNLVPYSNRPQGVQSWGFEGEARLEATRRGTAWLNASWQRATDVATPAIGHFLTDVPQLRFNAGFSLPLGPYLNADLLVRYGSERRNTSRSVLEQLRRFTLPPYTVVTAQLRSEPLFGHLELSLTGQNVFVFDYSDDVPRPDRVPAGVLRETLFVYATAKVAF